MRRSAAGLSGIKALTFDTGGTILDWHTGFKNAWATAGTKHGVKQDWGALANATRRNAIQRVVNMGENEPPTINFDDAHRLAVDELVSSHGLGAMTAEERKAIWWDAVHSFKCWEDFPAVLPQLRENFIVASFTILSHRIIIDTAKANGLSWDAVISCEAIGKYKILPEAYETAARYLQLEPSECLMVAGHNFDLNAARAVGFKTAFVRRPHEWGEEGAVAMMGSGSGEPDAHHDIIVDTFPELAKELGVEISAVKRSRKAE